MEYIETILVLIGVAMIVATLLPFLPADVWWVRGWEFPRVQIATDHIDRLDTLSTHTTAIWRVCATLYCGPTSLLFLSQYTYLPVHASRQQTRADKPASPARDDGPVAFCQCANDKPQSRTSKRNHSCGEPRCNLSDRDR